MKRDITAEELREMGISRETVDWLSGGNQLRNESISRPKMQKFTFDVAEQTKEIKACKRYVDLWDEMYENNIGLIMSGRVGCGKTYAAACIANALIDKGVAVHMTNFPEILHSAESKADTAKRLNRYKLLIIDDLGVERTSPYALEVIQYIVDERYSADRPLIVTTNLSKKELYEQDKYEYRRIYDRITEMCLPMVFSGDSRRGDRAKKKAELANKLFKI